MRRRPSSRRTSTIRTASDPGLSATIRGTFNPAALQGFAARDRAAERTADAVEKTEEHTRELARAARQSKLTFT
jgi:hypothetical protein